MVDVSLAAPLPPGRLTDEDRRGIINCALYENGTRKDISIEECGLARHGETGVVWLGLLEPSERLLRLVQSQLNLHELPS